MGYVGGIVLLMLLLVLFIQSFADPDAGGLLAVSKDGGLNIRLAILASALWYAVFAIPVLVRVPEIPAQRRQVRVGFFRSYVVLWGTLRSLWRDSRQVLLFLVASAVFRDGLTGVFTFGAIIAAQVFGFSATAVLYFAVAANVVAGISTFVAGRFDDLFGPKRVILASLICLIVLGTAMLFIGTSQTGFWIVGLGLCAFVGPVQSASRSFLARVAPEGREGRDLRPLRDDRSCGVVPRAGAVRLFVGVTGDTRLGILGIVLILAAGLLLMLPVKTKAAVIR